jgi:hypothetical protein
MEPQTLQQMLSQHLLPSQKILELLKTRMFKKLKKTLIRSKRTLTMNRARLMILRQS